MVSILHEIPPLLHDARLSDCRWDRHLQALQLCFQCLRRNVDGTPIEDSTVDLKLGGVERVVAYYSPASVTVKPSEFGPHSRIALADLEDWPHGAVEVHLAINSPQTEFEEATVCLREALVGDLEDRPGECPLRIHVSFEPHNYGPEGATIGIAIDCDSLEPFTNGVPLDIETWERQFEAWWAGWRHHWSEKGQEEGDEGEPALENTFIPAGQPDPPDWSYRPPSAAPFLLPPTTVPGELLKPIKDYHTGHHEQDWLKVAVAYPFLDQEPEERAARLRDQFLGHNYGRWVYVRHIDGWWCEGSRACVIVRGIEHNKDDNESPARNEETVITYGLRRFRQTWIIATWSQGWPPVWLRGQAPGRADLEEWLESWRMISSWQGGHQKAMSNVFTPGPTPNTVRTADGRVLTAPEGWALLPPGDATLTRRVKEVGEHWVVQEKKGRKTFSRGVWAPAATIDRIRAELEAERSTDGYAKRKEADARRRDKAQAEYVEDFFGAVVEFLAFHPNYTELANRLARAVTDHATPVGSGTVARTKRIPVEQRAEAAVIAWMRHQTTGYDGMVIPRLKGKRREVRRMLARRSQELLARYRRGEPVSEGCPLRKALAGQADLS